MQLGLETVVRSSVRPKNAPRVDAIRKGTGVDGMRVTLMAIS